MNTKTILTIINKIQANKDLTSSNLVQLFTSNSKLKKESIYSFSLPAGASCPFAGACLKFCYANKGAFKYSNVIKAHERNLSISKTAEFVDHINANIAALPSIKFFRLHSSGDFYSVEYIQKWVKIASMNPDRVFYAYTKSMQLFKGINLPSNFLIIQSEGTLNDDKYIDRNKPFVKVVHKNDVASFVAAGFIDSSSSDLNTIKAILTGRNVVLAKH